MNFSRGDNLRFHSLCVLLNVSTYRNHTIIGHSLSVAAPLRFQVKTHILARDYSRVPNTSVGPNKSVGWK